MNLIVSLEEQSPCTNFHGNLPNTCWDISVWNQSVELTALLELIKILSWQLSVWLKARQRRFVSPCFPFFPQEHISPAGFPLLDLWLAPPLNVCLHLSDKYSQWFLGDLGCDWLYQTATVWSPTPAEGLRGSYTAVRENVSYSVVGRLPTAPSPSDLYVRGFITLATLANSAFVSS